jgi:hypothetical protein
MTTDTTIGDGQVTFDEFREEWLREFTEVDMSAFEKGWRFGFKIVTQWLDVEEDDEDLFVCEGSGDGGIDIAYLRRSEVDVDNENVQDGQTTIGDVWYLFQSKYGMAFQGGDQIVSEGRKVIRTLNGETATSSGEVAQILGKLDIFRQQASDRDRIILAFATEDTLSESDRNALDDLRTIGRSEIGNLFDVEEVSLNTIWENQDSKHRRPLSVPLKGRFVDPTSRLRVGTVTLTDLYEFLKAYRDKTGNMDNLYERNVRQFLGNRRKVNADIVDTLENTPEMFGLYNNGITIIVSGFQAETSSTPCMLFDPYVVNGCQTTRSIWDVLSRHLEAGGTGQSSSISEWRSRVERGMVVTKIVEGSNLDQVQSITTYANSQNAVSAKDFLALRDDFRNWRTDMAEQYGVYLETQRGGWDSQRAYQKSHPNSTQFAEYAKSFDLLKVYGAAWLCEPGRAFAGSAPFVPDGTVFRRITETEPINVDDLYAAYKLQEVAKQFNFGRGRTVRTSRRSTKFLYYYVVMDLPRYALSQLDRDNSPESITQALLILLKDSNRDTLQGLLEMGITAVDEYMKQDSEDSIYKEEDFAGNSNSWLKVPTLGKDGERTARLNNLLRVYRSFVVRKFGDQPSPLEMIEGALVAAGS